MPEEGRLVIPDLQRVGKYDILERIADGGFATLFRGRDPFLKRLVAIKVCVSEDPELRQQFLREAEIAGNLDHTSIVRTFDFGFDPVGPYLVQEYLHGEDLSQLIAERAPLSARRKLDLLIEIAEGLAYSHAHLVLHLDIKPGNVRVIGRRHAKILDFGIARLASAGAAPSPGGMVGTAGYLPPEQLMGKAVDARVDVFAFGALAYELLTFCRPFAGGTIPQLLKRVLGGEAEPMKRHWPDCDDALANLVGRCLRRDPDARYPSFDVLLPELVSIRDRLPEMADIEAGELVGDAASGPEATLVGAPALIERPKTAAVPPPIETPKTARVPRGRVVMRRQVVADRGQVSSNSDRGAAPVEASTAASGVAPPTDALASTFVISATALPEIAPPAPSLPAPPLSAPPPSTAAAKPARRPRAAPSKGVLFAGLAVAAVVIVITIVAFFPKREPVPVAAAAVYVPPPSAGPSPGILVVTAAPWGEVTRVTGADGSVTELPENRVTPLRLWVAPGRHDAQVEIVGGVVVTCSVDVRAGGTHPCHVAPPDDDVDGADYWKEMGWWQ